MKFKEKTKDGRFSLRVKSSSSEEIVDLKELDRFSRMSFRGFLRPVSASAEQIQYAGPACISLAHRLTRPLAKREFLLIVEQSVAAAQSLQKHGFDGNCMVTDLQNIYINETTKELYFVFFPCAVGKIRKIRIFDLFESLIARATILDERYDNSLARFTLCFRESIASAISGIEAYVEKEDRSVVTAVKRHTVGGSGFITSKQRHYYEHYGYDDPPTVTEETGLLPEEPAAPPAMPREPSFARTDYDEATGLLPQERDDEKTGVLGQDPYPAAADFSREQDDEKTGILADVPSGGGTRPGGMGGFAPGADEGTGLLSDERYEQTGILSYDPGDMSGVAPRYTGVSFPSLLRITTQEKISVNKPVFRLGKERSYVDYFVTNNVAVSRSHADLITRGERCFVKDLNSKNHTYINGALIAPQQEVELHDGDRLKLGNEEFVFRIRE